MGRSPRFTLDQISKLGRKAQEEAAEQIGYGRKDTNDHTPDREVPDPKPKPHAPATLGRLAKGKAQGDARPLVRFVGFRVQPLDPDNFAGSVKDLIDGLRYAGLILGDEPWRIRLQTEQVRVAHFSEERTEIELTIRNNLRALDINC